MAFPFLEKMVSYSCVRRWYFEPKTNQDIYLEYESYVTDCTDMEDVLQLLITEWRKRRSSMADRHP